MAASSSGAAALGTVSDSDNSEKGAALNADLEEFSPKPGSKAKAPSAPIAANNPFSPGSPEFRPPAGGAFGTPVMPRRSTSPEYELKKAMLISELERLDREHGKVGDYDGEETQAKSVPAPAHATPSHSKYNYEDRHAAEKYLSIYKPQYLPEIPFPTGDIKVILSLNSIDSGYKKIEGVINANACPISPRRARMLLNWTIWIFTQLK